MKQLVSLLRKATINGDSGKHSLLLLNRIYGMKQFQDRVRYEPLVVHFVEHALYTAAIPGQR